jgi:DUF4097 and DUF4098 domain-containing protein YvlB
MEERMFILKMLQEGKITAEEAHKLLEAIDKNGAAPEAEAKKNEARFDDKVQKLQEKASRVAEKFSSTLNNSTEKISSNTEKLGDDFSKRMESFGNDIAESAGKFTDKLINYLGNFIDVGHDKYQYKKNFAYELPDDAEIKIDTCNFAVMVNPTAESMLSVNLYVNTFIPNLVIDEYFMIGQVEKSISIKTQFPSRAWGKIEINVPKHLSHLHIITSNGKCELVDITADSIQSNTSNGKICLYNCQSKTLEAITSNGKILASQTTSGFADFSTSNGKIEIEHCKFNKLDAKTSNGAIVLSGMDKMDSAEGSYSLRTSNGKIVIELKDSSELGYMIDATTSLGSITVELPQLNYFVDKKSFSMQSSAHIKSANFDTVENKILIHAHTSNSSISIQSAN